MTGWIDRTPKDMELLILHKLQDDPYLIACVGIKQDRGLYGIWQKIISVAPESRAAKAAAETCGMPIGEYTQRPEWTTFAAINSFQTDVNTTEPFVLAVTLKLAQDIVREQFGFDNFPKEQEPDLTRIPVISTKNLHPTAAHEIKEMFPWVRKMNPRRTENGGILLHVNRLDKGFFPECMLDVKRWLNENYPDADGHVVINDNAEPAVGLRLYIKNGFYSTILCLPVGSANLTYTTWRDLFLSQSALKTTLQGKLYLPDDHKEYAVIVDAKEEDVPKEYTDLKKIIKRAEGQSIRIIWLRKSHNWKDVSTDFPILSRPVRRSQ